MRDPTPMKCAGIFFKASAEPNFRQFQAGGFRGIKGGGGWSLRFLHGGGVVVVVAKRLGGSEEQKREKKKSNE